MALFQPPLSERSVTVSASLRSPAVNPVTQRWQVTLNATLALRMTRTAWLLIRLTTCVPSPCERPSRPPW